jgi:hypothetical protein
VTGSPDGGREGGPGWPVELRGVTETVVTTLGPEERWNAAALGVHAPEDGGLATARTWGRTRTRGNFARQGEGYVQFVRDPVLFVEAALGVVERDDPVFEEAHAWVRVEARRREEGSDDGTEWVEWTLRPVETVVREGRVPTIDRGHAAVVEATVWASRLGTPGYDEAELRERLDFLEGVVDAGGGDRERTAFQRLRELSDA